MSNHKTYLERTLEFHKIFNTEILPKFNREEMRRKDESKLIWIYRVVVLSLLVLTVFIALAIGNAINTDKDSHLSYLMPMLFTFLSSGTIIGVALSMDCFNLKAEKEYQKDLKEKFLNQILKVFGDIQWVDTQNLVSDIELMYSGLFPSFVERRVDDQFKGSYKGVNFSIVENRLFFDMDSSKKSRLLPRPEWQAFFRGCVLVFDMNKAVKDRTIIASKGALTIKHNSIALSLKLVASLLAVLFPGVATGVCVSWEYSYAFIGVPLILYSIVVAFLFIKEYFSNRKVLEKMNLEDLKFGSMFVSYTSDQIEGRYLVTPSFMERLINIKTAFGTKNIKCSFYNDKLMIAIETKKDLFEIGEMHKSLNDNMLANKMYDQISSIYHLIDYFKLDQNIGL